MEQQERKGEGVGVLLTENIIQKIAQKKKYIALVAVFYAFASVLVIGGSFYFSRIVELSKQEMLGLAMVALILLLTSYLLWKGVRLLTDLREYKSLRVISAYYDVMNRFWKYNVLCVFLNCVCVPVGLFIYFFTTS